MTAFGDLARRRMASRRALRAAAVACAWLLAWPGLGGAAPPITIGSVWAAPEGAVQEIQSRCGPVQAGRVACYRAVAARYGAPPATLDAIDLLQGEGHVTGFRAAGRVDLAAALFPFRPNQNAVLLVVNGDPPVVDVDDAARLAQTWEQARVGGTPPPVWLFPGDRVPLEAVTIEATPDTRLRLLLPYELRACRACPTLVTLWYHLTFDAAGRFAAFSFVSSAGEKTALGDDQATARIAPGSVVVIRLPANPSTGYLWVPEALPADGPLRMLWHAYRPAASPRLGATGEDFWWLEARQPGTATVMLRSLRPWQPDPNAPARQFAIEVAAP